MMFEWSKHDNHEKVIKDSLEAIERNKSHMTKEQIKHAYSELETGLGPDDHNNLCDRINSQNFQG